MSIQFISNTYDAAFQKLQIIPQDIQGCKIYESGISHPLFNGIMHLDLKKTDLQSVLKHVSSPSSIWVVNNEAPLLEKEGYQLFGQCTGMLLDLTKSPTLKESSHNVYHIKDYLSFKDWSQTLAEIWEISQNASNEIRELSAKVGFNGSYSHHAIELNNKIISTGSLLYTPEGAYIFNIGTVKQHRNKGFSSSLIRKLVLLSQEFGCKRVGLVASPEAISFFKNLGFEKVCYYNVYLK